MKSLFKIIAFICLSLLFVNQSIAQWNLNSPIAKEKPDHEPDLPNNGITSPLHTKYMGKIVFSANDDMLKLRQEKEEAFADKFNLGQPFFFRIYMSNSLSNYVARLYSGNHRYTTDEWSAYFFKFYIDGTPILLTRLGGISTFNIEQKQKWTTWRAAVNTQNENELGVQLFKDFFAAAESKLTPGEHKVKLEAYPWCSAIDERIGPMIAAGEFTLVVTGKEFDINNEGMCLPKSKMNDKAVEAGMLKAFNTSRRSYGEGKAARITEENWTIVRNQVTGIITKRIIDGIVAFNKDGKCQYQVFGFAQEYDGTKFLDQVILENESGSRDINCACLGK